MDREATFALQLFTGESPCRNSTTVPSRRQNERTDLRLAACWPGNSASAPVVSKLKRPVFLAHDMSGFVFKMLRKPKRDVLEFSDGRQITLGDLPAGLIFDVLVVPGSEQLSAVLDMEPAVQHEEELREKEPFLARLLTRF